MLWNHIALFVCIPAHLINVQCTLAGLVTNLNLPQGVRRFVFPLPVGLLKVHLREFVEKQFVFFQHCLIFFVLHYHHYILATISKTEYRTCSAI